MSKKKAAPPKPVILWVEGRWGQSFVPTLRKKGYDVKTVPTGKAALQKTDRKNYDLYVVDAASLRTSGKRICKSLTERIDGRPLMLISDPVHPVKKKDRCANVVLTQPFTSRKLVNRIEALLPGDEGSVIEAGPIKLNVDRNRVQVRKKKERLTPRLTRLLSMLIDHKGEVVEREKLFKKVWRTEYTGDTRTLDVHISWLRKVIEKDARDPQLLKTHRGVGYMLDV